MFLQSTPEESARRGTTVKEVTASDIATTEVIWLKESQIPSKQHNDLNVWKKQFRLLEADGIW